MAVRPVLRMGHPLLFQVAQPVTDPTAPEVRELLRDMRDTMAHLDGAGLAAPQSGGSLQVVIFGGADNSRSPDAEAGPPSVLINPVLTPLGDDLVEDWEGCLSVPGLRGMVPRHAKLRYQGLGEQGEVIDRTVQGFHARVVQHECDHLMGILYPMRMRDFSRFGFLEELFPGKYPVSGDD